MRSRRSNILLHAVGYTAVSAIILCAMTGCGYTTGAVLPEGMRTIHVEIFRNEIGITKEVSEKDKYETYRPNLEVDLRDAIIDRIFLDGYLKSSSMASADAVLEGEIKEFRKDPLRYQNQEVQEYRISLVCSIRLKEGGASKTLLDFGHIVGDTTYFTAGSLQKTEQTALNEAMSDLARRIVNRIVENW